MFIFFVCPKKTNQKKGQPITCFACAKYPVLLEIDGRCETRPPEADSDSPRAIPSISALLGCVKWHCTKLNYIRCIAKRQMRKITTNNGKKCLAAFSFSISKVSTPESGGIGDSNTEEDLDQTNQISD